MTEQNITVGQGNAAGRNNLPGKRGGQSSLFPTQAEWSFSDCLSLPAYCLKKMYPHGSRSCLFVLLAPSFFPGAGRPIVVPSPNWPLRLAPHILKVLWKRAWTGQTAMSRLFQSKTIPPCFSSNFFTCSLIRTSSSRFAERALYSAT